MKQKDFDFSGPSRSNQRAKRRKTNLILNSLIAIVILLIIIVSFTIFFSDGENASTTASGSSIESTDKNKDNEEEKSATNDKDEKDSSDDSVDTNNDDSESDDEDSESDTESDDTNSEEDTNLDSNTEENVVTTGGSDSNVKATITNPDWQAVGTAQVGEHVPVYDSNSTDWKEMEKAISYGTGLEQANMTLWFLGRNKEAENQSVATVSSKDNSLNFRVYIEWIDGQGWKPVLVEELYENDKR
jgi:cytoskeletal protein RodZ